MTFREYQLKSVRTMKPKDVPDDDYLLGLIGETGELTDMIKKHIYHGHALNRQKVKIELGDILFYAAAIGTQHGIALVVPALDLPVPSGLPANHLCRQLACYVCTTDCAVTSMPELIGQNLTLLISTVARIGDAYGITLNEIMEANVEKLLGRYPEGYSDTASQNRTI